MAAKVLRLLQGGEAGKSSLAASLGHRTVSGELHKQIKRLLAEGLVEMTIPDKPRSSKQRYRLTDKGRQLLEDMEETE